MDQNKLRTLVFEKTGIKIDTTDPVFAVVALNEAVLSEYLERHLAVMNDVAERVNAQTRQLLQASERYEKLLQHIGDASAAVSAPKVTALLGVADRPTVDRKSNYVPWIAAASGITVLTASLILGKQWMAVHQKNLPLKQAAPVIQAPLTQDQILLIQDGKKYAKMWSKLDAKTQARIQALIQQPQ